MPTDDLLRFACPNCQQNLSAPPELYGQSLDCPACSSPFVVPRPAVAVPISVATPYPVPEAVPFSNVSSAAPALWNPNAAANWSLLFTPAFGSYLLRQNARTLGRQDEAGRFAIWFWFSIIFYAVQIVMIALTGENPLGFWSLALLVVWYFSTAKKQAKFVKATYGGNYVKKPWGKPLLTGAGIVLGSAFLSGVVSQGKLAGSADAGTSASQSGFVADAVSSALSSATGGREAIFSKSGDEALEEARKFMVGVWTYTEPNLTSGYSVWYKFDVRSDGTVLAYEAPAVSDNWGDPKSLNWGIISKKYMNTGERYYEVEWLGEPNGNISFTKIFIDRDRVNFKWDNGVSPVTLKRGDAFPFSK